MLTENDNHSLNDSFITPELTTSAKIERVDDEGGALAIGRRPGGPVSYSGLLFPYFVPGDYLTPRQFRLRRDHPDLEIKKDGTAKEVGKYLNASGQCSLLYFPPGLEASVMSNTALPLVITEGEKKTLALHRLSTYSGGLAFLALGLSGVWNWRRTVPPADTDGMPTKETIPDLDLINWSGRSVTIVFDANVRSNESVAKARDALATEMAGRGAIVKVVDLTVPDGVNGVDDLLGVWERQFGTEEAVRKGRELLAGAMPWKPRKPEPKPQRERLIKHVLELSVFQSPEHAVFVDVPIDGQIETHPIGSDFFRGYLTNWYYETFGKLATVSAVQDAITAVSGLTKVKGPIKPVNLRVARDGGSVYVDLTDEQWRQLKIDPSGTKIVESRDSPARFRRSAQSVRLEVGDTPTPGSLQAFLNLDERDYILALTWLVQALRPEGPYPILIVSGEQGAAKSTLTRLLRKLVDPNAVPLRGAPRSDQDLAIAAQNSWVLCFDNVSRIKPDLADALCRIATGSGFATRKLFKDDEEVVLASCRPVILNGIGELSNRSDLLDRAVVFELKPIPDSLRREESEFWADFDRAYQGITRFLVDLAAKTLTVERSSRTQDSGKPRLADFAALGDAVEKALEFPVGTFRMAYDRNRSNVHDTVIEDSPLANVLLRYVEGETPAGGVLVKTMLNRGLVRQLRDLERRVFLRSREPSQLPQSDKGFRDTLQRLQPNLRHRGLDIQFLGRKGPNANRGASLRLSYRPTSSPDGDGDLVADADASDGSRDDWGDDSVLHLGNVTPDSDDIPFSTTRDEEDDVGLEHVCDVGDDEFNHLTKSESGSSGLLCLPRLRCPDCEGSHYTVTDDVEEGILMCETCGLYRLLTDLGGV
jgi:hypothetical protein